MQQILKRIWVIRSQVGLLLLFQAQQGTEKISSRLDQHLQSLGLSIKPEPKVRKGLRGYLVKRLWFRVRKIQLTLLAIQDFRVPKVRREWRRQFRALQGLPDLREMQTQRILRG